MRTGLVAFLMALLMLGSTSVQRAEAQQQLVADLSNHLVAITTDFSGAELLLFGAVDGPGEIIVTVTGPRGEVPVRKKSRVLGVWANTDSITFENVPSFYAVAATSPLDEATSAEIRHRQEIGLDYLAIRPVDTDSSRDQETIRRFKEGLIRNKEAQGLYVSDVGNVSVFSDRLFRTTVRFPANVVTGQYLVSVYYIQDGSPVHAQTTPLVVSKIGLGAEVYLFAHRQSAAYGVVAVLIAVAAGWLAAAVFRKV